MAELRIDFEWWRDPAGYRMSETKIDPHLIYHPPKHRKLPDLPGELGFCVGLLAITTRSTYIATGENWRRIVRSTFSTRSTPSLRRSAWQTMSYTSSRDSGR